MGTGFALVKIDVGGNIDRLSTCAATKPEIYDPDLFQIIRDEVEKGINIESTSCTKGLLWLKRAMEFIVTLLNRLYADRQVSLSNAASETYCATLQHFHGWIVTGTFTVALKLVPSRDTFFHNLGANSPEDETAVFSAMREFCQLFGTELAVVHKFLNEAGLDDPAKVFDQRENKNPCNYLAMFRHSQDESSDFLPGLTRSFIALDHTAPLKTTEFTDACGKVLPIFDHIGTVFLIAKHEFGVKMETVVKVADRQPLLDDVVAAGKQDGSITVKNSPARNLHRLLNTLAFISAIFKGLKAGKTLKDAVSDAYDTTLGMLHTWVVRTGIKAGMLGLPSREHFLKSIGETEESAIEHAEGFTAAADALVSAIENLYQGVEMPKSDFNVKSLWYSS